MTKRPLSPGEIDELAARLEQIEGFLSDRERAVLGTVFDLVRDTLSPAQSEDSADSGSADVAGKNREHPAAADHSDLAAGFENAFQPGGAAVFAVEAIRPPADQERKQTFKVRLV